MNLFGDNATIGGEVGEKGKERVGFRQVTWTEGNSVGSRYMRNLPDHGIGDKTERTN